MARVSVIIPVYFNEESLSVLLEKIREVTSKAKGFNFEFIFVDDGSGDRSFQALEKMRTKDIRVKILKLVRNFGSHSAIMAGLSRAQSECQIILGADLQDPPDIIPRFLERWKNGNKIVVGIREKRRDPWLTTFLANTYYRLMRFSFPNMPTKGFDIFLIDNKVRQHLLSVGSRNMSLVVSILWTGYRVAEVPYIRGERPFGESHWSLSRRIKLAIDSLTTFSYLPILFLFLCAFLLMGTAFLGTLTAFAQGAPESFHGLRMLLCLGLGGIGLNAIGLGVIGEYLWRNLEATRRFPSFLIDREIGFLNKHK